MPVTALAPQASASANSATFANEERTNNRRLAARQGDRASGAPSSSGSARVVFAAVFRLAHFARLEERRDDLADFKRLADPPHVPLVEPLGQADRAAADDDERDAGRSTPECVDRPTDVVR